MTIDVDQSKRDKVETPNDGTLGGIDDEYRDEAVKEVSERLEKLKKLSDIEKIKWIIASCECIWHADDYDYGEKLIYSNTSTQDYHIADYIRRFIRYKDDALEDLLFSLKSWGDSI